MKTQKFHNHEMESCIFCCMWCGATQEDFENGEHTKCDGTPGVYHIKYLTMRKQFYKIIQPLIDKLLL
mgnify:CR=1 FL=1